MLLLLPIGLAASRVQFGTSYVENWLPGDSQARVDYREFRELFGDDQFLLIAWTDCNLADPRLPTFANALRQLSEQHPEFAIRDVQDSLTAVDGYARQANDPDQRAAIEKLQGIAIGVNETAFIAVQLGAAPLSARSNLIAVVERLATRLGIEDDSLILAGEPYQVHVIDRSSRQTINRFVAPSSILSLIVACWCLRSLRLTAIVFGFAGIGQIIGLALIATVAGEMSAVLVVLPTLVFMLTLSAAIHLAHYYLDAGGPTNDLAGVAALRFGLRPCVLATLTTMFGFASLFVSQLAPVWQFGALAAAGLFCSVAILLAAFPAAVQIMPMQWFSRRVVATTQRLEPASQIAEHRNTTPRVTWVDRLINKWLQPYALVISIAGILTLLFAGVGLTRLQTSTEFEDMFSADSRVLKNLAWVETNLGSLDTLEFLFTVENPEQFPILSRVALLSDFAETLEKQTDVQTTLSATTFLPQIPKGRGARNTIRRAVLEQKIEANFQNFRSNGLLAQLESKEVWRISTRLTGLTGNNYPEVSERLLRELRNTLQSATPELQRSTSFSISGMRAVMESAHHALLTDLGSSFVAAFLLITPVMMFIVRGVASGLILMIPNVLPVVIVFGSMGWLSVQLDVASILTASVALGIAVDDTLHFLSWYLRQRQTGSDAKEAVAHAIRSCARPIFHTTLICTGAMVPFFFSDFIPTSKFALLMILILGGAVVGDLILLPAILLSPIGNWIGRRRSHTTASVDIEDEEHVP